ncbi:Six-hairpin glycosidase-like protein [Massariosphaeria phaeospora]|uniref:Six-hairpin glycosidase-like protein n=1 Tax=Massariosphaeria phaeospora TaxID=100035 RepID=A0A7C8MY63_9PLEO|nr:Six-hairpin glycosidase-like protein [Massariosphaeria phaeospora]
MNVVDFFPRPKHPPAPDHFKNDVVSGKRKKVETLGRADLKKWLVLRVECIRGEVDVTIEVFPAFNYAQDTHTTHLSKSTLQDGGPNHGEMVFKSKSLSLQLSATVDCGDSPEESCPVITFNEESRSSTLGKGVTARFHLKEGQAVSFIFREYGDKKPEQITTAVVDNVQAETQRFWSNWISPSTYRGRWQEVVTRSLFILKLLTYEPTGAIVAAPTFSLPEDIGGGRNWDYRFSWIRDSSFTIYVLLRLGFTEEAEAYTNVIFERIQIAKERGGSLPIMFDIRGHTEIPELELSHLEGYRNSKPVRIGNGAASHTQLDIYGELMDGIYLSNRFGKPVTYDQWLAVREITDYVCTIVKEKDMSIWEVRGEKQNFVYSKIMLWVAIDRALRLAEKRGFPCPQRWEWYRVRDEICEEVMEKGYNKDMEASVQSYEILKPPEKGGLTSAGLVYRYNTAKSDDGVGGSEGAFSLCTFWLVEALTRAGAYDRKCLPQAVSIFENMMSFANHLHVFSEEIARSGEQLGNTSQAFSHLALISAAFRLDRTLGDSTRR